MPPLANDLSFPLPPRLDLPSSSSSSSSLSLSLSLLQSPCVRHSPSHTVLYGSSPHLSTPIHPSILLSSPFLLRSNFTNSPRPLSSHTLFIPSIFKTLYHPLCPLKQPLDQYQIDYRPQHFGKLSLSLYQGLFYNPPASTTFKHFFFL